MPGPNDNRDSSRKGVDHCDPWNPTERSIPGQNPVHPVFAHHGCDSTIMHEITLDGVGLTADLMKGLQVLWAWVDSGDQRLGDERLNILKGLVHPQWCRPDQPGVGDDPQVLENVDPG